MRCEIHFQAGELITQILVLVSNRRLDTAIKAQQCEEINLPWFNFEIENSNKTTLLAKASYTK